MQKYIKLKECFMLVAFMLASVWCAASNIVVTDVGSIHKQVS